MKILLIGNFSKDHQFSIQKFTNLLSKQLVLHGHETKICKPKSIFSLMFSNTVTGVAKWLGYIDKYILFPFRLKRQVRWADIVHICDHSNSIYVRYVKNKPHLVTCHDLMAIRSALGDFPENCNIAKSGQLQQRWIANGLTAASFIASVSKSTEKDLKYFVGQGADLRVIYNGLNYPFRPMDNEQSAKCLGKYSIDANTPFLLHIGGNQWYKNRLGLIEIYYQMCQQDNNLPFKLILAGKPLNNELKSLIARYNLEKNVIEITGASTREIMALYSLATAFIFPSIYEGFGWPIIEALACNTIVFTSDREPMNEIGNDAVIYFDPNRPSQAAKIILDTLSDSLKLVGIKANASAIVEKFSTSNMIVNYVEYYEYIIKKCK
ncbi:MAG: glycosyltransferase family 4 protein [Colwellia sp.]|nr:glycosyltransferase family 4 protein [Colwellia sp.]